MDEAPFSLAFVFISYHVIHSVFIDSPRTHPRFMRIVSFLSVSAVVLAFLTSASVHTQAQQGAQIWPQFGEARDLGSPLPSTQAVHGVVTEESGVPVLVTTVSGDPGKLNILDLENGKTLRSFDVPHGKTFWTHAVDSKGDVFFAGYTDTTLYHYSVATATLREIGRLGREGAACSIAVDDDDNVYIGTFPNAKLFKFERAADKLHDLGPQIPGQQYLKTLVYHEGYLYGGGLDNQPPFIRIDTQTLKVERLPSAPGARIDSYYYANKVRNLLFMMSAVGDGRYSLFVYDLEQGKWLDLEIENYRGLVVSPEMDGRVYFSADGNIWTFDLDTREAVRTAHSYGTGFRGGGVVGLKQDSRFAKDAFVNLFFSGNVAIYNFAEGRHKTISNAMTPAEGLLSNMILSDGQILVGEHMGTRMAVVDLQGSQATQPIPLGQPESIGIHQGKFYFGVYPSADIQVFDASQPARRGSNPQVLFSLKKDGQSRPFGLAFSGSRIITGTVAEYGKTQGALAVYDLQSGKLDVYKDILPEQNYTSLIERDGIIWGATTIFGGLGSVPAAKAGQLFRFDPVKGEIIRAVTPQVPGVTGPIKGWGALRLGPDGLLWAVAYGMVAAFDPVTLEFVKKAEVVPTDWKNVGRSWGRHSLEFSSDGFIVSNPGGTLVLLNPETMQWKRLLPTQDDRKISQAVIAPSGDIYYRNSTNSTRLFLLPRVAD